MFYTLSHIALSPYFRFVFVIACFYFIAYLLFYFVSCICYARVGGVSVRGMQGGNNNDNDKVNNVTCLQTTFAKTRFPRVRIKYYRLSAWLLLLLLSPLSLI